MKRFKVYFFSIIALSIWSVELKGQFHGSPGQQVMVTKDLSKGIPYGYYEYLPQDFDTSLTSNRKYPLVIYFPGVGGLGDGSAKDLPKLLKPAAPPRIIGIEGRHFPAIVISAQHGGWFDEPQSKQLYDYITSHYNIDSNRVYVTGLSAGGSGTWKFARAYPDLAAAIVPVAGAALFRNKEPQMKGLPIWAFHNVGDGWGGGGVPSVWTIINADMIADISTSASAAYPGGWGAYKTAGFDVTLHFMDSTYWDADSVIVEPKQNMALTFYDAVGHNGWGKVYRSQYMWDWLFAQSKEPKDSVVVNAGSDAEVILPTNATVLNGSAYSLNGSAIASYLWTKVSGPSVTMHGLNTSTLSLQNLVSGTYQFSLTAMNMDSTSNSDIVEVTVKSPPTSDAGGDINLILPEDSTVLDGSNSSDIDGTIIKYDWKLIGSQVAPLPQDSDTVSVVTSSKIYINFTVPSVQASTPWNNINGSISTGVKLTDMLDSNGSVTNVDLEFLNSWNGSKRGGKVTGNNSGVYPDNVIDGVYWFQNKSPDIKISGLDTGATYTFTFFGSRTGRGLDKTTVYQIGTIKDSADASENTTQTAVLSSIVPNASGEVVVNVRRGASAAYGYLNAIVIESHVNAGSTVVPVVTTSSTLSVSSTSGVSRSVFVNFTNNSSNAASPWNNTNGSVLTGSQILNLLDSNGTATGIDLELLDTWNGQKIGGKVTGNNSGVYPDDVIAGTYWFQNRSPRIKISGLDVSKTYDFTFFGSRTGAGLDKTTVYEIGGMKDSLNATENTTETADIVSITPDANGEVVITIRTGANAQYGYLNALVIKEIGNAPVSTNIMLTDADQPIAHVSGLTEGNYSFELTVTDNEGAIDVDTVTVYVAPPTSARKRRNKIKEDKNVDLVNIKVYPNPVRNILNVEFSSDEELHQIRLFSNTGQEILAPTQRNGSKIQLDVSNLKEGFYFLHIQDSNSQVTTRKIIVS